MVCRILCLGLHGLPCTLQPGVSFSYAGILSMIISLGTIVSSLHSDRFTRALCTGKVTALSVGMTATALFPFYLLVFLVLMHRQLVRKTAHT